MSFRSIFEHLISLWIWRRFWFGNYDGASCQGSSFVSIVLNSSPSNFSSSLLMLIFSIDSGWALFQFIFIHDYMTAFIMLFVFYCMLYHYEFKPDERIKVSYEGGRFYYKFYCFESLHYSCIYYISYLFYDASQG